jgi:VWFA-related protein
VGTDLVVLDVVVRDKKGRTVRDLRPEEVQVFEDGVAQSVASFRLQAAGEEEEPEPATPAAGNPPGAPPARGAAARHVNLVTLVFDQLGVEGRRIARQAGLDLLKLSDQPDLLVSVFQIKESLRLVQQFTSDRERLHQAILESTGQVATQYTKATESLETASRAAEEAQRRLATAAQVVSAGQAGSLAQLGREADLARMTVDSLRLTETLQREQQGHSSLYAILALSRQQQRLAGRKTILYFAEGLQVPPQLEHVLLGAISEANRANVSVYAVDARGLNETRALEATRDTLNEVMSASQQQMTSGGVGPVSKEQVKVGENALAALRMDTQGALADLALGTGGLLIANGNDVRKGIERAVGDLRGYYEVSYEPSRKDYDGKFRRLEVRVTRPGVTAQTRSGYFAIPPEEGSATFAFEVDLLRALRAVPAPTEFPLRSQVFRFGPEADAVRYTAVLEIPLSGVEFEPDGRGETDRAHFSMITVVRDASGAVIENFSEDSPVFLPRQQRDALKQGNAVFTRSFLLVPGHYTVEAAAVDQLGHRRSVQRSDLNVSAAITRVSLSDVAVVKRSDSVPSGTLASEDPFRLGESRIVPFLTEPHLKGSDLLSLFLVAYARKPEPRPELLVELVHDGRLVTQTLLELPAPDGTGRIPYVAKLPVEGLSSGRYEVRVLLKQGGATAQGKTYFTMDGAGREEAPPTAPGATRGARIGPDGH